MKKLWLVVLAGLIAPLEFSRALVNPKELFEEIPGWVARIYVGSEQDQELALFCYGALIGSKWVVSSVGCFNDTYRILESYGNSENADFQIRLGSDETGHKVVERYRAPDAGMMLYELLDPVDEIPVVIADDSYPSVIDTPVEVLGLESSAGLGDSYYNTGITSPIGSCTLEGHTFYSQGTLCYLFTYPIRHNKFLGIAATVIDPPVIGESTKKALDDFVTPLTTGERLYLKFDAADAYSCLEDMGMPITRKNTSGERELLGITNIVGGAAGLPLCSGSLFNWNTRVAYYRDFIEQAAIEAQFRAVCPVAPVVRVSYNTPDEVVLEWESARNATGYTVHYSTRSGVVPIKSLALGNKTRVQTTLKEGVVIEAAVQALNNSCTSPLSNRVLLKVQAL